MLEQACAQAAAWRHDGLRIPVSVNVSLLQLQRPEFAAQVAEVLQRHRLPSDQLCLELGESVLTDAQVDGIGAMLDRIAAIGVSFAIDNFGLGHSSLRNLCRLPIRQLKIDRALVGELLGDAGGEPLVRAAIGIGRSLGKDVLGEGSRPKAASSVAGARLRPWARLRLRPTGHGRAVAAFSGHARLSHRPPGLCCSPACRHMADMEPADRRRREGWRMSWQGLRSR